MLIEMHFSNIIFPANILKQRLIIKSNNNFEEKQWNKVFKLSELER